MGVIWISNLCRGWLLCHVDFDSIYLSIPLLIVASGKSGKTPASCQDCRSLGIGELMSNFEGENTHPGGAMEWTPQRYISILFNPANQNLRVNEGDLYSFYSFLRCEVGSTDWISSRWKVGANSAISSNAEKFHLVIWNLYWSTTFYLWYSNCRSISLPRYYYRECELVTA